MVLAEAAKELGVVEDASPTLAYEGGAQRWRRISSRMSSSLSGGAGAGDERRWVIRARAGVGEER